MGELGREEQRMPVRHEEATTFIAENFATIWPVHLAAFTRLLTRLRAAFDGDLDLLLILAAIGDRTRPENWAPELRTYRQLTNAPGEAHLQYPINIQSVADFTGIPRETVRRKVAVLRKKGWLERGADGRLAVSRTAASDLEGATGDTISYLAALLLAMEKARAPGP